MIVTLEYLRQRFREFNALCFNSRLPEPILRVGHARTMLGCVRYKKERTWLGSMRISELTLSISSFYNLTQEELDDTILHEMIHLDIICNHKHRDRAHGSLFRQIMNDINLRFNRHINISHRGALQQAEPQKCQNIIAVTEFQDGEIGLTRASLSRLFELERQIPKIQEVRNVKWYHSRNPFFNRFPRSLKPKFYRINQDILNSELQDAIRVEFIDGKIKRMRNEG